MKLPKISIVILNWNGAKYLDKTIPKIININYPNKEIIVVDNKSEDNSLELLEKYHDLIIIKNEKNYGYSKGKNIGVNKATGEYILLLDNDILIEDRDIIIKLIEYYCQVETPALICSCLIEHKQDKTPYYIKSLDYSGIKITKPIASSRLKEEEEKIYKTQLIFGGNLFFKKNIWDYLGGYDESLPFNLDDYDISVRAHILGFSNYILLNHPINTHLGSLQRYNSDYYIWSFKYQLAGHLISNIKNFKVCNALIISFLESVRIFLESIKQSIARKNLKILFMYFYSVLVFFQKIPHAIRQRKIIQACRKNSDHSLLSMKINYDF